jgi:sigma-B regulation protein RsbU (phosphoserine phosphatase)
MQKRYIQLWRRLGRVGKAFLLSVVLYAVLHFTGVAHLLQFLLALAAIALGAIALLRVGRRGMKQAIWRLRNRLIAAYLFIAVVPIVLIVALLGAAGYGIIGQMAVYLVNGEIGHHEAALLRAAELLARFPQRDRETAIDRFTSMTRNSFPQAELCVTGNDSLLYPENVALTHPPAAWSRVDRANGLILKDGNLYIWAHVKGRSNEVTALAPLNQDLLANFVPGLGDVNFLPILSHTRISHLPPPVNAFDIRVEFLDPIAVPHWESPDRQSELGLLVVTRLSSVLGIVFGQTPGWGEKLLDFLIVVSVLFLLVEIASLAAGVQLTRTITGAVHELYEGTQRVKEGDFSYRVPVKGSDQLGELTASFNTMTENLGRLIVIAKEKERLESELEIAREVQAQLFPKDVPSAKTLEIKGFCQPARTVSGDYYDFVSVPTGLAFAIGDVAGKGISAALLMASIQSAMRTQLSAVSGNGRPPSAARLVSILNRQLYATTSPEKYATFYFALYDEAAHSLTYTNAGHLSPLLLRGSDVQSLDSTGTVVGAFPTATYEERTVLLEPGDLVVAYTDGIVEPENEYGEMFGEEQLKELLIRYEKADSSEIIARTMEAVREWTHASEPPDDMTMVVARRI